MPNPALVSADFIIGGSFKPKPDDDEEEEEEEKEEDENRDAIVFVVCAPPPRAGEDEDEDDERPLRDFPKPSFLRINARFQNSPPRRLLPPLFPPDELNASAPNFPSSTNRMLCIYFKSLFIVCFMISRNNNALFFLK
jgi:hypothetical protein